MSERTPLLNSLPRRRAAPSSTITVDLEDRANDHYDTPSLSEHSDIGGDVEATMAVNDYMRIQEDNILSSRYTSLDYDVTENELFLKEEESRSYSFVVRKRIARWFVMFLIGILTALIGAAIDIIVDQVGQLKFGFIKRYIDGCAQDDICLTGPLLSYASLNMSAVFIACLLVLFLAPAAAGSGIPLVKCYLNGVLIPEVVRLKTLFVKCIGVICAVLGGLIVGKEGPMIHIGSAVAAGVSQGHSPSLRFDPKIFKYFRSDQEKRDFVSGGAAAGVAAAFGTPVGGVLFALEEGASFWNQALTCRILFASMTASYTLSFVLSYYHGTPWSLSYSGLFTFGKFVENSSLTYNAVEIPIFMLMGVVGGILGGLFNWVHHKLAIFRVRHVYRKWNRMFEALMVCAVTAASCYILVYLSTDCEPLGKDPNPFPVQMFCKDGEFNVMGSLVFQNPEASIRSLFHDRTGTYEPTTLLLFFLVYFWLAVWTFGIQVPSGLFIPLFLLGAAWGRLVGIGLYDLFKYQQNVPIYPGKYALVGSAAMVAGVCRMTISLTVMLSEATGSVAFGLPILIVVMTAKWCGDLIYEGIYEVHVKLAGIPFLNWEAPPLSYNIPARDVMSHPVTTFRVSESVARIYTSLKEGRFDGFPVVDDFIPDVEDGATFGRFQGLILRSQLIILLKLKAFNNSAVLPRLSDFSATYPRLTTLEEIELSPDDMQKTLDLAPYMNRATYTVSEKASLPKVFKMFRALGLRHVVVLNQNHKVLGMVTRTDLARYRMEKHKGKFQITEVHIAH